jgi:anti-sigma B factor antagonist
MTDFSLATHRQGSMFTAIVRGELDGATSPELQAAVADAVAGGATDVLIDCRGLVFADSTGLGALVAAKAELEQKSGSLVLFGPPSAVRRALQVTGLLDTFLIVEA